MRQLAIYGYGSSNLRYLVRNADFKRVINQKDRQTTKLNVKIRSTGINNLKEPRVTKLLNEIKWDIEKFGAVSDTHRLYTIIHLGYNQIGDADIPENFHQLYSKFLLRLSLVVKPATTIVYLPFIRGTCPRKFHVLKTTVGKLQEVAEEAGFWTINLFQLSQLHYDPSEADLVKFYSKETYKQGVLKAIHFSKIITDPASRSVVNILRRLNVLGQPNN